MGRRVACMPYNINAKFYSEDPKGRDRLGCLSLDWRIILKCITYIVCHVYLIHLVEDRDPVMNYCVHGNEPPWFHNIGKFFECLSDC